jgi:ectoine hydroxylase-related dioxygenase (phytanoyl-CoA dioxygenase family)
MWIALDDVDEKNGALEYVIGSHRWGKEYAPSVFVSQTPLPDSPYPRLPDIESRRNEFDIRSICAKPGDIIVHDVLTVHGARGNCTNDRFRRGISFRYCGDDIRYFDKPGAIKQPWIRDQLRDGAPLYSRDYPRVWPLPFPGAEISRLYD